jgi:GT2 family glycosyltransferase
MTGVSVSVAIPAHQPSPHHLQAAVRSVGAQTRPPDELVVVDDSPTSNEGALDGSSALAYRHRPSSAGMVANWNRAVHETTGELVVLLHQDDQLLPGALEAMAALLGEHPDIAICGVGEIRVDDEGQPIGEPTRPNHRERVFLTRGCHLLSHQELSYLMLRNGQVFGEPSALMFRRTAFDACDGFDDRFAQSVDIDFALRLAQHSGAAYLTDRLIARRCHEAQATATNIRSGRNIDDRRRLYDRHFRGGGHDRDTVDRVHANLTVRACFDGARALRAGRWVPLKLAAGHVRDFRCSPGALLRRAGELALWVNRDAR